MAEYIEREAAEDELLSWAVCINHPEYLMREDAILVLDDIPAADVAPVVHGRWELTVRLSSCNIFNESCELCVCIVANCSECSEKHPNSYHVFSKTIYAPEDAGDDFRFDKKEEVNKALQEFRSGNYQFACYCPNCGAKMDGGGDHA